MSKSSSFPPRHPQSAGKAESSHIMLKRKLLSLLKEKGGHWSHHLNEATTRANGSRNVFNLNHSYELRLPEMTFSLDESEDFETYFLTENDKEQIRKSSEEKIENFVQNSWPEARRKICDNLNRNSNVSNDDLSIGDYVRILTIRSHGFSPYTRGPAIVVSVAPCGRVYGLMSVNTSHREIQHRENLVKLPFKAENTIPIPFSNFKQIDQLESDIDTGKKVKTPKTNIWYFWNDPETKTKRIGKLEQQLGAQVFLFEHRLNDLSLEPITVTFSESEPPVPQIVSVAKDQLQRIPVHSTLKVSRAVYNLLSAAAAQLVMC
jgi:hypothetical protein